LILVDPAVGSNELVIPLRALGLEVSPTPIDADIAFEGRGIGGVPVTIGIEYKKLGELVGSLRSERLQGHQLYKMNRGFDYRWLLIEGEVLVTKEGYLGRWQRKRIVVMEGRMTLTELYKRLLTLQVCGGWTPVFVESQYHTLRFLEAIYRFWTDVNQDEHKSHIAIYEPPTLVPPSQFRRTVFTLPGVGLDLAGKAERHFGSLREAFNAEEAAWCGIDGIGSKTARKIVSAVTRRT
jgi:ERCC4-type nuclease